MKKTLSTIVMFLIILGLPSAVFAQSLSISPSSATVSGSQQFNILINGPLAGDENTLEIRMSLPTSLLNFTGVTTVGNYLLENGCAAGGALFDAGSICMVLLLNGTFTAGDTIATVTVGAVGSGSADITFDSGTQIVSPSTTVPYSGTAGTYSTSGSGLPDTGLLEDVTQSPMLLSAGLLIMFGLVFYRLPGIKQLLLAAERPDIMEERLKEQKMKKLSKQRTEFESKFTSDQE